MPGSERSFATLATLAAFAACISAPVSPAAAGEISYCVTCQGPDRTYLCKVVGEGSRPNDALKLYCIIRTAKEGNHASCKAKRDIEGCVGEPKVFSYEGPNLPADIASDPRAKKWMGKLAREQKKFEKPKGQSPQTLVELTSRAYSSSRQGIRNAREAIGGTPDEAAAPNETTASTPSPSPQTPAPNPQASAPPPEQLPIAAEPAPKPASPSRARRMKNAAYDAGSAVGGFAKKSYRCMWSLFRNCSGETRSAE